jgi:hypothetical protein
MKKIIEARHHEFSDFYEAKFDTAFWEGLGSDLYACFSFFDTSMVFFSKDNITWFLIENVIVKITDPEEEDDVQYCMYEFDSLIELQLQLDSVMENFIKFSKSNFNK